MRLFAAQVDTDRGGHETAYALLAWAWGEVWGGERPEIGKTAAGKPYFIGCPERHLSLSHTKSHVLVGLSEQPLGVDVETLRPVKDRLRDRLFTPEEQRDFAFFEGWTLREAVYKLTGEGSLWTMRIERRGGKIVTPFSGVRCRLYDAPEGCVCAAACRRGRFPARIEIVPADRFLP